MGKDKDTRSILVWSDGTWCRPTELPSYFNMSDDYTTIDVLIDMDDEQIELYVDTLIKNHII